MAIATVLVGSVCSSRAEAQVAVALQLSDEPVPEEPFESWSLFLVCNPRWLLPQSDENLWSLYQQFVAFGGAIGPRHAALWFWNSDDISRPHTAVDIVRSAAWCDLLDLELDENPHVVITTDYPGASFSEDFPDSFNTPINYAVLSLNGLDADEVTELLTEFAQKIRDGRIFEVEPNSEAFWRGWQRVFEAVRDSVLSASSRAKFSMRTPFFNVDVDLGDGD